MSYLRETPFDEKDFPTLQLIKADYGFIPNFFLAQTIRPDLLDAEVQFVDAILIKDGALTRRQKEYIFLVCSARESKHLLRHCTLRDSPYAGSQRARAGTDRAGSTAPIFPLFKLPC